MQSFARNASPPLALSKEMQGVNAVTPGVSFKLLDWAQNMFCVVIDLVSVSKF